eukprot:1162115-Pelagomonas_calceolata.AAC.3
MCICSCAGTARELEHHRMVLALPTMEEHPSVCSCAEDPQELEQHSIILGTCTADNGRYTLAFVPVQGQPESWNSTGWGSARAGAAQHGTGYLHCRQWKNTLAFVPVQGIRKSWSSTVWYMHCQQETRREPTPPKERPSPSAAMVREFTVVTDGGYTKRGSVAERGMALRAGNGAVPGALPGRRGSMMLPTGGASALQAFR